MVESKKLEKKVAAKKIEEGSIVSRLSFRDLKISEPGVAKAYKEAYSEAIRVIRQNHRQGTVGCKGRGDVSRTTKKPWKQKGTGRARAGTPRSPLWRGGGVTFGPQERGRKLKLSAKIRRAVCNAMLLEKLKEKKILSLDWIPMGKVPRTSDAYKMLKKADLIDKKVVLLLSFEDQLSQSSFSNIPNVHLVSFDQPNAYVFSNKDFWVFLKRDIGLFKEMVSAWI